MKNTKKTTAAQIANMIKKSAIKGNSKTSINELFSKGYTRTGSSGYSKGWSHKSIWTSQVLTDAAKLGLTVISGNDAPRGGASGEYVKLVADKRKNKLAQRYQAIATRAKLIGKIRSEKQSAIYEAKRKDTLAAIQADAAKLLPFAIEMKDLVMDDGGVCGWEKSKRHSIVMHSIMQASGVTELNDFWKTWKALRNAPEMIHRG